MKYFFKFFILFAFFTTLLMAAPLTPAAPDLLSTDDTGLSTTDNVTKLSSFTLNGSKLADQTITVYRDGSLTAFTDSSTNTNYSIVVSGNSEGIHTYSVTATDTTGESFQSGTLTITLDFTVPTLSADLAASSDWGFLNTDYLTADTTPLMTGTVNEYSSIEIGTAKVYSSTTWSMSSPALTTDGNQNITIKATDRAGNETTTFVNLTLETVAPVVTINLDTASDSGVFNDDNITNDNTPSFSGTTTEEVSLNINGQNIVTSNSWSYTYPVLTDGYRSITVSGVDRAGNTFSKTMYVTIDTSASAIAYDYNIIREYNGYSIDGTFINDGYRVEVTTDIESGQNVTVDFDSLSQTINNGTNSFFFVDSVSFVDGATYIVDVPAGLSDKAGNIAAGSTATFVYDKTSNYASEARPKTLDGTISEYLDFTNNDLDYFKITVPEKGLLSVSTNELNAYVEIKTLQDLPINKPNSNSLSMVVDSGVYLIKVEGTHQGAYNLTSSFNPYAVERDEKAKPNALNRTSLYSAYSASAFEVSGGML